jgi:membrane protease YdiL (CAAX protease family)
MRELRPATLEEIRRVITNAAAPHHEPSSAIRRRRVVVAGVLVAGAGLLALCMTRRPGEPGFYWLTLAVGVVWAIGAFTSGPLHLGGICWRGRNQRPVITGTAVGLLLGGIFVIGGVVTTKIPGIADLVTRVLQFVDLGPWRLTLVVALLDGIAEELFYRGALYTALGRHHPVVISTAVYTVATLAGQNLMLGFAAVILGTVCAAERRATGGVLAPILTHVAWSLIVLLALPPVFGF